MDPVKLSNNLTALGVLVIMLAVGWWLYVFLSIPRDMGVSFGHVASCLFHSGGMVCALFSGIGGYQPIALWFGFALLGGAWLVRESTSGADGSNQSGRNRPSHGADVAAMARDMAARAQRALLPDTDRIRKPVQAPARSAFAAKNYEREAQIRLVRSDGGRSIALSSRRLRGGPVVLGRQNTSDEVVDSDTISRRHAKLWIDERDRCQIEDLGSANGTWLDGQRITRATLVNGARLRLGEVDFAVTLDRS